ncbi:hypothetical protein EI94DRAFT_1719197 [Lactarius quietus]|nr:hypothetical protein EI94DRAFT_1719197 [Lactarius quietus]
MGNEQTPNIPSWIPNSGRANAGKTSILQRVCETTESPTISRGGDVVTLDPSVNRGENKIDDELSSPTIWAMSGSAEELEILKEFVQRKCGEKKLRDRLHAIWYCVPMDNHRPELDLKFYDKICPDPMFLRNVKMDVGGKLFQDHYVRPLGNNAKYVRLEKMHMKDSRCDSLVEETAAALNEDTVVLMLLAVQRGNIELSVKAALSRVHRLTGSKGEPVIRECLIPFPYLWASFTKQVRSLPAIQNIIHNDASQHHLIIAIILILKHATFLWPSNKLQSALSQAEQNYQRANMDSNIQEYLKAFSSEDTVERFAGFIMATDMVPSQSSVDTDESSRSGFRSQFLQTLPIFQKLRRKN